jgi:hypothetical protein
VRFSFLPARLAGACIVAHLRTPFVLLNKTDMQQSAQAAIAIALFNAM